MHRIVIQLKYYVFHHIHCNLLLYPMLISVGGSLPVTISYYSEFLSAKKTGPLLIVLKIFWLIADMLIALLAWGLLGNPCLIDAHIGSMPFRSWRVFTMLCTLPAITVAPMFILLPESPSWLYTVSLAWLVFACPCACR